MRYIRDEASQLAMRAARDAMLGGRAIAIAITSILHYFYIRRDSRVLLFHLITANATINFPSRRFQSAYLSSHLAAIWPDAPSRVSPHLYFTTA